jgi:hypothetical protein
LCAEQELNREIIKLTRRSEPEVELKLLLDKLKLELPVQPSPKITAAAIRSSLPR